MENYRRRARRRPGRRRRRRCRGERKMGHGGVRGVPIALGDSLLMWICCRRSADLYGVGELDALDVCVSGPALFFIYKHIDDTYPSPQQRLARITTQQRDLKRNANKPKVTHHDRDQLLRPHWKLEYHHMHLTIASWPKRY